MIWPFKKRWKYQVGQLVRVKDHPDVVEHARGAVVTILALPGKSKKFPDSYQIDYCSPPHDEWYGTEEKLEPVGDYDGNERQTWTDKSIWKPKKVSVE